MNIYFLNPPLSVRAITADIGWMNFNTYCPEYNWIEPIIDWDKFQTIEQLVDEVLRESPQVLCISTYVWNHILCFEVAKRIKITNPEIKVIMGGPHQGYNKEFFNTHPYIDYVCFATAHGELFLKIALEQIAKFGKIVDPEAVPFLLSREYESTNNKIKFEWTDASSIENNIVYLFNVVATAKNKRCSSVFNYETTRGCPYSCVYCEWGGGTSSKVSQKPLSVVLKDIEICGMLGFTELGIIDANFGILDRDVTILQHVIDVRKDCNTPKEFLIYGIAKSKVEKRERILDLLFENKLSEYFFMALQAYDEQVIKDAKRTDITFDENFALARKYRAKYGIKAKVELIMGLPGYTLDIFYKEMDLFQEFDGWFWPRNIFTLLPNTEANNKLYQSLNKIQTTIVGTMDNEEQDITYSSKNVLNKFRSSIEIVVGTRSYSKEDWKQMYFMNRAQKILGPLVPANKLPSVYLKAQYDKIKTKEWYKPIEHYLDDIVNGLMYNKDISMIENFTIEEIVEQHAKNI
jgi:tRNA A37 methylthiotransferase MiaB